MSTKVYVKKEIQPVKIPEILGVKPYFLPVKKIAKVGVKTKSGREKSQKSGKKWA